MISIWGKHKQLGVWQAPEVIDRASDQREANYLAAQYQMCHDRSIWVVWAGRRDQDPSLSMLQERSPHSRW